MRAPMPAALASGFPVLIVAPREGNDSAVARSAEEIVAALGVLGRGVVRAEDLDDAEAAIGAHPALSCVVVGWNLASETDRSLEQTRRILRRIRAQAPGLPVLLGARRGAVQAVPLDIVKEVEGALWVPEDSAAFIAGRIDAAARRYLDTVLPPFFGALANFAGQHEYSWHTPGHTGGTAFMKTAVGRAFLGFYGEQLLRSDLSVSVGELGSLNDHSGPVAEAERHAARVFGADYTYFSVGGSSASNEIILHSAVADGDVVLVDRNCHKSVNYALSMSGAIPVYLKPRRNARGVIGPVPASELDPDEIRRKIEQSPLVERQARQAGARGADQLDLRRALLRRRTHDARALGERRPDPLRRGLVCVRPLQPGLREPLRHAPRPAIRERRHCHSHPFHAQAARGALAGVDDPHPLRTRSRRARLVQRGVHDAHLDLSAVQHHRLDGRVREDDGGRGPGADRRVHPRGGRLPPSDAAARKRDP